MDDVWHLPYLEAALKETLRLHLSVPSNTRHAVKDTLLSYGTFVKTGATIGLPTFAIGRMTHVWGPDAAKFEPARWLDPETGKLVSVPPFKFFSFHAGPCMCIGMNLTMLETKIVVASLLSSFHVDVFLNQHATYEHTLTLSMRGAFMVRVARA